MLSNMGQAAGPTATDPHFSALYGNPYLSPYASNGGPRMGNGLASTGVMSSNGGVNNLLGGSLYSNSSPHHQNPPDLIVRRAADYITAPSGNSVTGRFLKSPPRGTVL